jgi:hypothetical protein
MAKTNIEKGCKLFSGLAFEVMLYTKKLDELDLNYTISPFFK